MRNNQFATLSKALNDLRNRGFENELTVMDYDLAQLKNGAKFSPEQLVLIEHHRFEGFSNPADNSVVYALEAQDGTRSVIVDGYGKYGDEVIAKFLMNVRDEHPQNKEL